MEVIVTYTNYNEKIKHVELPINAYQKETLEVKEVDGVEQVDKVIHDETISHMVTQTLTKEQLRDYIQVLQKIVLQMK